MANSPIDVLWIARYDYSPGWELRPHDHDFHQLILFLDGRGVFTLSGARHHLSPGEVFLIPPGQTHGLRAESRLRTLDVKFRVGAGPLRQALHAAPGCLKWNDGSLAARLERIRAEGERKQEWYRELCASLLAEILYLYIRQSTPAAPPALAPSPLDGVPPDSLLHRAIAHIHAHATTQLQIRHIAAAVGCSDRALRLHFHAALRRSPLEFLQRHRIALAKDWMRHSDYSLKEIAGRVGFQTVHHFTRLFTELEGSSPAAWRRQYLEGIRKDVYINPAFTNRIVTVAP